MKRSIFLAALLFKTGVGICATNPVEVLEESERVLRRLKQESGDVAALKQLPRLFAVATDDQVRDVLAATYSLSCLSCGDIDSAAKAAQSLAKRSPDSPYLAQLSARSYEEGCPDCKGSSITLIDCPRCNGKGLCARCNGKGSYPRIAGPPDTCVVCKGAGRCTDCGGKGRVNGKCPKCAGSGKVLSTAAARTAYIAFLDVSIPVVHSQVMVAKGLIEHEGREMTPAQRDAAIELRKAQATAALAAAERRTAEERSRQANLEAQTTVKEREAETTRRVAMVERLAAEKELQTRREEQRQEEERLQAERRREGERLQAERDRQRQAEAKKQAKRQRMEKVLSDLGDVVGSVVLLSLLVGGFTVSLRVGSRLAKVENVTLGTAMLASVTALVAQSIIILCCLPLLTYALITALVLGIAATSFTVKAIFRATWEQAVLTNMFALAVTTVGMTILILIIRALDVSLSILNVVTSHVPFAS